MSKPYQPREHDHLVEPMFAALREEHEPPVPSASPARRDRARLWLLGLIVVVGGLVFSWVAASG